MGVVLFISYALILCAVSFLNKNKITSNDGFFVNARATTTMGVAISTLTSCVGASATIGVVGLSFDVGIPAFWWLGSGALGLVVLGGFLANRVRASKAYTLSEIIASLLGKQAELIASVIIVFAWTAIVTAQLVACVFLIQALLGTGKLLALLLGCLLITLHTISGGQSGIIHLDKFQVNLIIGGVLTLLIWGVFYSPSTIEEIDFSWINHQFPLSKALYLCFILGGSYIVCPMLYGRVLSARDENAARNGILLAAFLLAIIAFMIVLVGIYARGIVPSDTTTDQVLITLLSAALHPWLAQFIYLFLLCAVVSSADSCLFAASSALSRHLLRRDSIYANRWSSLLLMGIAVLLTFTNQSILDYLLMANNIYVCSIVIPVMMCFLFRRTANSIHQPVMLSGMILAGILGAIAAFSDQYSISYLGLICSLIFTSLSFAKR